MRWPTLAFNSGYWCYSAGQASRTPGPCDRTSETLDCTRGRGRRGFGRRDRPSGSRETKWEDVMVDREDAIAVRKACPERSEGTRLQFRKMGSPGGRIRDVSPCEDTILSVPTPVEPSRVDPATAADSSNHRRRFSIVVSILSSRVQSPPWQPGRSDRPPPQAGKRRPRDCPGPRPPSLPHGWT